jgi:hypothetical protein
MAISIQFWAKYTENNKKLQRKSENSVYCNHVLQFLYDPDSFVIKSTVQASMKDRSYKVDVSILNCQCDILCNVL